MLGQNAGAGAGHAALRRALLRFAACRVPSARCFSPTPCVSPSAPRGGLRHCRRRLHPRPRPRHGRDRRRARVPHRHQPRVHLRRQQHQRRRPPRAASSAALVCALAIIAGERGYLGPRHSRSEIAVMALVAVVSVARRPRRRLSLSRAARGPRHRRASAPRRRCCRAGRSGPGAAGARAARPRRPGAGRARTKAAAASTAKTPLGAERGDPLPVLHRLGLGVLEVPSSITITTAALRLGQLAPADLGRVEAGVAGDVDAAGDRDHLRDPEAGRPAAGRAAPARSPAGWPRRRARRAPSPAAPPVRRAARARGLPSRLPRPGGRPLRASR